MLKSEYELVESVQNKHWWWLGREKYISMQIKRHIPIHKNLSWVDVGCGFGANIPLLRSFGDVTGLEINEGARKAIAGKWGDSVKTYAWLSPDPLDKRFNCALLADVLEHIEDDKGAVRWLHQHILPGGYVLVTVPAHMFFWTQMDEVLHHHRRYTRESLIKVFQPEFEVVDCRYYNFLLFPVKLAFVVFDRLIRMLFPQKPKQSFNGIPRFGLNKLFEIILKLEAHVFTRLSPPTGISLIILLKKRETDT